MIAGILTFHYAHHYGRSSGLRADESHHGLGADCEIIDYVRKTPSRAVAFKKFSARALLSMPIP